MSKARDLADGKFDTDTLVVDAANNRVGIGTSSPSALAHVYNGTLQVGSKTGDTSIQQNTNAIRIAAVPNSTTEWGGLQWYREFSDYIGAEIIATRPSTNEAQTELIFKTTGTSANATERMRIDSSGNVGIGTSSPQTKFTVQGPTTANNIEISGEWIQSFNRGGSPGYQVLPIYASAVTMPLQPAFDAYISGANPSFGTTPALVGYNATNFNIGNHYDTTNKRFVAPVAGRYLFRNTLSIYLITSGNWFRPIFYKNGSVFKYGHWIYSASNNDQQIESTLLADLSANDYIDVRVQSQDTSFYMSAGSSYGSFSGFLVG